MRSMQLTPEQADLAARALAAAGKWLREFIDRFCETARSVMSMLRQAFEGMLKVARSVPDLSMPDRPAWQSPYGPRRKRRTLVH